MLRLLISFLFITALASCAKDKPKESELPYYFKAIINGKQVKFEADDEGRIIGTDDDHDKIGNGTSSPYFSNGWNDVDIYEGTVFMNYMNLTSNVALVHIIKHFNHEPSDAQRLAMFHTGSYNYGQVDGDEVIAEGATINYIDDQGVEWRSVGGAQNGSTFTITELVDNPNQYSHKIFKANFNCKLYDFNGNSIQLTNGEVRGQVLPR